ncbi:alpha-N-acetylglucosaminidase TIM-barrel domain-containing protein [Lapidilactobacillus dextrinicus]|uniref:alpha-N-acetylglucosaminidase TIM-barrel domain-containing protein n=1 Tax=Lapidilactobacillus dextrinicus TaxID=51664 RepID=UPI003F254D11
MVDAGKNISKLLINKRVINIEDDIYQDIWELPTTVTDPIVRIIIHFRKGKPIIIHQFKILHAFNHVLSDLTVDQDKTDLSSDEDFIVTFPTPKSISHILVQHEGQDIIDDIDVYIPEKKLVQTIDDSLHVDSESISYLKPVHSKQNQKDNHLLTDGSLKTVWQADQYPAYADIDLQGDYQLDRIKVYFPEGQRVDFQLYISRDGEKFTKIADQRIEESNHNGELVAFTDPVLSRYLRLKVLYNSGAINVQVRQVRVFGQLMIKQTTTKQTAIKLASLGNLTAEEALYGIIERRLGKDYRNWFTFDLRQTDPQTYQIESSNSQVKITAASGVVAAAGLNYYLKYYCQVNLSQSGVGDHVDMPSTPKKLEAPVIRRTETKYRYAYNFTTYSYTMAYWNQTDWQNELDWLALNGVNLVLDPLGQEAVWALFLRELGYNDAEIKDEISAGTYSAWQWMGNIMGIGGPVSFQWINQRLQLAQHNHTFMKALGMTPVLQGYGGLVPDHLAEKQADINLIPQGQWCSFHRPEVAKTDNQQFLKLAETFYRIQNQVFGEISHYYAVDPFHEGGNRDGISPTTVANQVLTAMLAHDAEAVWVVQAWQENPTPELIKGIHQVGHQHALVLDLYAEKDPQWIKEANNVHGGKEFGATPWVFCLLNNFGGRMGLSGHLDVLNVNYLKAINEARCIQGIGITPEASLNNPILFDYLFEMVWHDASKERTVIDNQKWLQLYAQRRYGNSTNSASSLSLQLETVYCAKYNQLGQGAPESIINARPAAIIQSASTWGNSVIAYDKTKLIQAFELLLKDFSVNQKSAGYRYDLVALGMQVLSNKAQDVLNLVNQNLQEDNQVQFARQRRLFFEILELVDQLAEHIKIFRLATWLDAAKDSARNLDDYDQDQFMLNARMLVTTWGSLPQANNGGLHDYSNRQWSGLTRTLYKQRWQKWFETMNAQKFLHEQRATITDQDWFDIEWDWVCHSKLDSLTAPLALKPLMDKVLKVTRDGATSDD